jgi:hypothetical protein
MALGGFLFGRQFDPTASVSGVQHRVEGEHLHTDRYQYRCALNGVTHG